MLFWIMANSESWFFRLVTGSWASAGLEAEGGIFDERWALYETEFTNLDKLSIFQWMFELVFFFLVLGLWCCMRLLLLKLEDEETQKRQDVWRRCLSEKSAEQTSVWKWLPTWYVLKNWVSGYTNFTWLIGACDSGQFWLSFHRLPDICPLFLSPSLSCLCPLVSDISLHVNLLA